MEKQQTPEKIPAFSVAEISETSYYEAQRICAILNSENNRPHFAFPYSSQTEVLEKTKEKGRHIFVAQNKGGVVGTATLSDAPYPTGHHSLYQFAISEKHQGKGYGRQLLNSMLEYAFSTPTYEGKTRGVLHAGVILGIEGWEKMYNLLRSGAFIPMVIWPDQFDSPHGTLDVVNLAHYPVKI